MSAPTVIIPERHRADYNPARDTGLLRELADVGAAKGVLNKPEVFHEQDLEGLRARIRDGGDRRQKYLDWALECLRRLAACLQTDRGLVITVTHGRVQAHLLRPDETRELDRLADVATQAHKVRNG